MDKPFDQTHLDIDASYYSTLDIRSFGLMLKDPSYCYKFYWLEAIMDRIYGEHSEIPEKLTCRRGGKMSDHVWHKAICQTEILEKYSTDGGLGRCVH